MIGGLVPAAGFSSRMGVFKPLLELEGVPALARGIRCLREAGAECAVVTGHRREALQPLIAAEGATELYNPDYAQGMFSSVCTGIRYFAHKGAEAVLLLPGDCPAVPPEAVKELIAAAAPGFAVPSYLGKKGHPLWIPARFFREILAHDGTDGLKGVTRRYEAELRRLPVPFAGVVLDMDRPEDYRRLLALKPERPLAELARGRRFFLLRHGATELHSGKVIMGRYDARLSPLGREQMRTAGERLLRLCPKAATIYTSPLRRARDSALLLKERLGLGITQVEDLQEISLGAWDGLLIDEVKRRWPEEYERRGQYLMSYRFDEASESFYDVQYRAVAALRGILERDGSPDLLLLSHAGVLKCLYGALQGRDIDWAFPRFRPEKGELTLVEGE